MKRYFFINLINLVLGILLSFYMLLGILFSPSNTWAHGNTPETALLLRVGEGPIEITIENPGDVIWVRAEFDDPDNVSHVSFETMGEYDTYMYLYKDLEDALADNYLEKDDDSGEGYNAKICYSIGYPSPYYLKLKMYSNQVTGTFQLDSEMYYEDPEDCPHMGPCAMVAASKNEPDARKVLFIMRSIKNNLLIRTELGCEVIDLYYAISKDIFWDLLADLQFARKLYSFALNLMPLMEEILKVSINEGTGMVLSQDMIETMSELKDLLKEKISKENFEKLEAFWYKLNLNQNVGKSIEFILSITGFLPSERVCLTLDKNLLYLASKFDLIIKFRKNLPQAPKVVSNQLITGIKAVDEVFSAYLVNSICPVFRKIKNKESTVGLERIYKICLKEPTDLDLLIQKLIEIPEIEYAEKNKIYQSVSNDVYFPLQYPLENHEYPEADIRATEAWELETGNPSVLVSVVDTGIDYYHADLKERVRVDLGYDYVNEDADPLDDNGHGTHVAGIIGASYNNFFAVAGVAPGISLIPFKVLDEYGMGTADDVALAIQASADVGANVINLSLGGDFSNVIEDALHYAYESGSLAIAAAGNDGIGELTYPASSEYTVSVGATDNKNQRAYFSNYGEGLDIMAPGDSVLSLYISGLACFASGTSMATPHVCGVAALIISKLELTSVEEIKNRLFENALDLGDPGYDTEFGWGLVDAFSAIVQLNQPPVIDSFTANPIFGNVPLEVTFTCAAHDPDGYITEYRWDFDGDGNIDETTTAGTTTYTYQNPGIYYVKVTVVDNNGATTTSDPIAINVSIPLNEALDNSELSFTTGGDALWFGQNFVYKIDGDAAQSGDIADSQETYLETAIIGPGIISFWWKVSSEENYDFLEFYIDGELKERISGERDWEQKSYEVNSGSHILRWQYLKDHSISEGDDCGWVDCVEFTTVSLLHKYTPILKFNQGERYFPTKVEDMTTKENEPDHSDIWEYRPFWPDTNLTEEKEINTPGELKEYLKDHPNSTVYFDLDDDYWKHWTPTEYVVYGREYHPPDPPYNDRIYLQYWFFYIYNDWWNDHEGDWEMITVELDKDGNPLRVGYSQHHRGVVDPVGIVKTWNELMKTGAIEENHPVVYVAEGSHASYPNPGRTFQTIDWDEHYGNGEELRPSDYQLSNMEEGEHWEWINIEQLRWGKCDWPLMQEEYPEEKWNPLGNDGPPSPVAQGDKWERPGAWLDSITIHLDIKINGKDNPTISLGTPVVVTISLDPGESNAEADWWVWAETPFGLYCYNISKGWFPISDISEIIPVYQGKLMFIIGVPILWEVLPAGTYTFHFAVDLNPDGNLGTNRYEDVAQLIVVE